MKLKITIENKTYEVDVEASEPEPAPLPPIGSLMQPGAVRLPAAAPQGKPALDEGPVNEDKVCRSPINGIVVKVGAQVGQEIHTNDTILVLEAMKMETNITAPVSGKISKIRVKQGDSVQAGQILADFE